jgi:Rad3-related DNA helicase
MVLDSFEIPDPLDYGVPHTSWRPNQLDALNQAFELYNAPNKTTFLVLELPTGSGKSSIPTALGAKDRVVVYVHSLALLDQYRDKYGFTIVKGMDNYPCVNDTVRDSFLQRRNRYPTVGECPFDDAKECPVYDQCPYFLARDKALASQRMACTYPFALLSYRTQARKGIAVWDEAHTAAESIINLSAIKFDDRTRRDFSFGEFPFYGLRDVMFGSVQSKFKDWLNSSLHTLGNPPSALFPDDLSKWRTMQRKLSRTLEIVDQSGGDFYYDCWYEEREYTYFGQKRTEKSPYLTIKPFTAGLFSHKLHTSKDLSVLMSATIGNPAPLARELGLSSYLHNDYPHPTPIDKRPVYDLGFSKMIWDNIKKFPNIFDLQARRIWDFIKTLPPDWRGLILCASYEKTHQLRRALAQYMGKRIFDPEAKLPGDRTKAFREDPRKGLVAVEVIQGWGQGLDFYGDIARFVIIASVPFGNLTDRFEEVRRNRYGSDYAWWFSYMSVPQGCGRVTRGEQDENGDYILNVSALADGSATTRRALVSYPRWFREAITPWTS